MENLTREEFEKIVGEAIEAIPEKFLRLLDNVAVVVEDEPTAEQHKKLDLRRDQVIFGLYEGVPQVRRGAGYGGVLPDKITIFKKPIEGMSKSKEEIKNVVRDTVWHEIAHHFGMSEARVRRAEQKKRWSQKVTEESNALDLEQGVFTWNDPKKIAQSLKRSARASKRRKGTAYQSAMSMLNFYINRAGKNLPSSRRKLLNVAKGELRKIFGR